MLDATQEATIAMIVPELNQRWLDGYAQLQKISSQYALGAPDLSAQRAQLDAVGQQIIRLNTITLLQARNGEIGFDTWASQAQSIRDTITNTLASVKDTSILSGLANGAASAAAGLKDAGGGIGIGIGVGLVILGLIFVGGRR